MHGQQKEGLPQRYEFGTPNLLFLLKLTTHDDINF